MAGPKNKLKKGNIFFFLLLIAGIFFFLNKDQVNQKLEETGISETVRKSVEAQKESKKKEVKAKKEEEALKDIKKTPTKKSENAAPSKAKEETAKPKSANSKPSVQIVTEKESFIVGQDFPFTLTVKGDNLKNITPVSASDILKIKTIDAKAGKYVARSTGPGIAEFWVTATIDGKLDILHTHELNSVAANK